VRGAGFAFPRARATAIESALPTSAVDAPIRNMVRKLLVIARFLGASRVRRPDLASGRGPRARTHRSRQSPRAGDISPRFRGGGERKEVPWREQRETPPPTPLKHPPPPPHTKHPHPTPHPT